MSLPISLFHDSPGIPANTPAVNPGDYQYPAGLPNLGQFGYPQTQAVPSQDQVFLKWLFSFREQTIVPLKHLWSGDELDENGSWQPVKDSKDAEGHFYSSRRIMNKKGVTWCISFIESFLSPVFLASNYDQEMMYYIMNESVRTIYYNLTLRYKDFDLKKSDIDRVAIEIESKIQAILLGARGDGYRKFFSSTTHHSEDRHIVDEQKRQGGFMSRLGFRKPGGP